MPRTRSPPLQGYRSHTTRARALKLPSYARWPWVYTVGGIERFDWQSRPLKPVDNVQQLPLDRATLGDTMKKAGYATALFGKWHLGQTGQYHPGKRGFDEAIVTMGKHFDFVTQPAVDYPKGTYLADFLTDKAIDFIQRKKDAPFFLCLHHFGVHSPHEAKPELVKKFENEKADGGHKNPVYAAMIASVDESVGRVLAKLDELKLSENTLVVFTADNGGVGGYVREGIKQGGDVTDNAPLRGGKGMLYEGGIRVAYLFRWTGKIEPNKVCDQPINSVDLYPTLLELSSAEKPKQTLDGVSYLPVLMSSGNKSIERDLYWHFPGYLGAGKGNWRTTPVGAIRSGDWKLHQFFEDGKLELYNLKDDIGEKKNLAATLPEKRDELHKKLIAWRESVKAPMPVKNKKAN